MEDTYDVIILGTGLTECVLSGLLSVDGKKVLHLDANDYYGGACSSLNLDQMLKHTEQQGPINPVLLKGLGKDGKSLVDVRPRDYNIDLVPKFLISQGNMVKILLHTDVTRYLEFKSVDGSYVYKDKKVYKVPATEKEALGSSLMGLFEKKRFKDFLEFATQYDEKDPATHKGVDATKLPAREILLKKYSLDKSTADFVGHSMALYTDDKWLDQPCLEFLKRVKLYTDSLMQAVHQYDGRSPYLYPLYGLGDLPQAFARLSAIYGGTYMLNKPIKQVVMENGKVVGVQDMEGAVAKCSAVIGDPSYFKDKVKKVGQVVRCVCILDHPIPNTDNAESCQIIVPQSQVGRQNDIYIFTVSAAHMIAPKGKWVVIVATIVETAKPEAEVDAGLALLGPIQHKFFMTRDIFNPANNSEAERIFISKSYDAQSHFESVSDDVMRIYKELTGKNVDLTPKQQDKAE